MFELVPFKGTDSVIRQVPRCFKIISGKKTQDKLILCNKMVVDWQIRVKQKNKVAPGKCPWLQPGSQNTQIRTFFAFMKSEYNWPFTENDLSGFSGCLNGVLKDLYKEREEKWVSQNTQSYMMICRTMDSYLFPFFLGWKGICSSRKWT